MGNPQCIIMILILIRISGIIAPSPEVYLRLLPPTRLPRPSAFEIARDRIHHKIMVLRLGTCCALTTTWAACLIALPLPPCGSFAIYGCVGSCWVLIAAGMCTYLVEADDNTP